MADDQNRKTPIQMTPEAMQEALAAEGKKFEAEQQTQKVEAEVDDLLAQITAPSSQAVPQQSADENKTVDQLLEELLPAEKAQAKDEEEKKKEQEMISVGEASDVVKAETEKNEAKEEKTDIELDNLMKGVFGDDTDKDKESKAVKEMEDLLGELSDTRAGKASAEVKETPVVEQVTMVQAPQLVEPQDKPQEAVRVQQWVSAKPSQEGLASTGAPQAGAQRKATLYIDLPNADDRAPKATVYTELPKSLEEPTVAASAEVKETPSVEQAVIVPDLQLVEQKPQEAVKAQQWVSARPTAVQEADDLISALSEGQTADSKMKAEADNLIAGLSEGQTAELSESEIKSMLSDLEAPIAAPQPEQEADPKRQQVTDELMKAKESATLQMQEKKGGRIQEILERGKQSEHKIIQKVSEKASSFLDRVTNSKSENKDVQR